MFNINTTNLNTNEKDTISGNYSALDADVYDAEIKLVYGISSKSSKAEGIELVLLINGQEKNFSLYYSTSEGKIEQLNKKTNQVEAYYRYVLVNSLFNIVLNKNMNQITNNDSSKKFIKKYNYIAKADENIEVNTIPAFEGKKIKVGITNTLINKYSDPSKTINKNEINKFFDSKGYSSSELNRLKEDSTVQPEFINKWLEANKGIIVDKVDKSKVRATTSVGSKSVTELNLDDEEL